ncbi:MAG TPA: hypothetical protein VLW50_21220 [Streptosporangiaceae bacterium]|nr:hypothetical protein [Streptosporangiaceae bacterium]
MRGLTADFDALDRCRAAMLAQAGQFGGIADGFSSPQIDSRIFGTLTAGHQLAGLAGQTDEVADAEFGAAEAFLRAVERALDAVRHGVSAAEQANVNAIQSIS